MKNFLEDFKNKTEALWSKKSLDPKVYGYQIQPNTKWLSGHNSDEIQAIKEIVGLTDLKEVEELLKFTKGFSLKPINVNSSNEENKYSDLWHLNIDYISTKYKEDIESLKEKGSLNALEKIFKLPDYKILPIYGHRYIVIDKNSVKVYSIYGTDIIVYGNTLEEYLSREFLM